MASPTWKISGNSSRRVAVTPSARVRLRVWARGRPRGTATPASCFTSSAARTAPAALDGLSFAVLLHTPGPMSAGNWTVGLIVDDKATPAQREALTAIGSGQGGGPMAAVGPLVGTFAGVEAKPIRIERSGMRRSVSIAGMLDIAVEGIPGASPSEPIYLDNVGHPAATRLALAKASRGHMHAFGINWDDTTGKNNGHFAPFSWSSS